MEFLWPILAKIELICQQTQVTGAHPSWGVPERMTEGWLGGLAITHIISHHDTAWHQGEPVATTKLKKEVLDVYHYWHLFNQTLSTINTENAATNFDIVNGVKWSRNLTQNYW